MYTISMMESDKQHIMTNIWSHFHALFASFSECQLASVSNISGPWPNPDPDRSSKEQTSTQATSWNVPHGLELCVRLVEFKSSWSDKFQNFVDSSWLMPLSVGQVCLLGKALSVYILFNGYLLLNTIHVGLTCLTMTALNNQELWCHQCFPLILSLIPLPAQPLWLSLLFRVLSNNWFVFAQILLPASRCKLAASKQMWYNYFELHVVHIKHKQ
jgi:hypothetical protein